MDRHQGHPKGTDHRNHQEMIIPQTLSNNHGTRTNKIATTNSTTTRVITTMADTEGTTLATATITRDTAGTTTIATTTVEEQTRIIVNNPPIRKEECTG